VAVFWALLPADDPPRLRCPGCQGEASFRGWCQGLQDLVPALAPLLPPAAGPEGESPRK
jgi:hypothetical protein